MMEPPRETMPVRRLAVRCGYGPNGYGVDGKVVCALIRLRHQSDVGNMSNP